MIQVFQPDHGPREIKAATRVIKRGWCGEGQESRKLLGA